MWHTTVGGEILANVKRITKNKTNYKELQKLKEEANNVLKINI